MAQIYSLVAILLFRIDLFFFFFKFPKPHFPRIMHLDGGTQVFVPLKLCPIYLYFV